MTIPMLKYATLFNAVAVTATVNLNESDLGNPTYARSVHLEINGGSTPNWALDIQGRVSNSATWHNIDYFRTDQGAAVAPSNSQLTVNWTTAQHYVIPNPPPFMRLVGARTGGTLTVYGAFSSEAYSVPFPTVGLGAGTAIIGKMGLDTPVTATTATETGVAASAASGAILAAAATREGCIITNSPTSARLYLRFSASAASIASGGYSVTLAAGESYEMGANVYSGAITGIWEAASGYANVTEW